MSNFLFCSSALNKTLKFPHCIVFFSQWILFACDMQISAFRRTEMNAHFIDIDTCRNRCWFFFVIVKRQSLLFIVMNSVNMNSPLWLILLHYISCIYFVCITCPQLSAAFSLHSYIFNMNNVHGMEWNEKMNINRMPCDQHIETHQDQNISNIQINGNTD